MKASELRIGNFVNGKKIQEGRFVDYVLTNPQFLEVDAILQDSISCKGEIDNPIYRFTEIEPISLTKEWFFKLGFKKISNTQFCIDVNDNKKISLVLHMNSGNWTFPYFHEVNTLTSFKNVHELQNLYFALTGTELTIKELV